MTRADDWRAIAEDALSKFETGDDGLQESHAYAYILGTVARLYGWADPRIATYLSTVYAMRKPDGGWGLRDAWDAFQDGTTNPADTTYTVTLADHVGPVLLDAYLAGVPGVAAADIQTIVDLLATTNAFGFVSPSGQVTRCIAYSRSAFDVITSSNNRNVHNVSAQAAAFMARAHGWGFTRSTLPRRVVDVTLHELDVYNPTLSWWPYKGPYSTSVSAMADTDHTAAQAEAMYSLAPWTGRSAAKRIMSDPATSDNSMATVARMRLTGLPARPDSMSTTEPGATIWAVYGDDWLADAVAFVASETDLRHIAQAAYWASRNALVT